MAARDSHAQNRENGAYPSGTQLAMRSRMHSAIKIGTAMVVVLGVAAGCSSASDVGQSDEALSACSPSDAWFKSQYDDKPAGYCEGAIDYSNCGPASMAMMRYALTCGKSDKTAAQMRAYINQTYKNATDTCGSTGPTEWNKTFDHANSDGTWFADDKYPTMTTSNHCQTSGSYAAADLADDMESGAVTVAIIAGSAANGQKGPCGWDDPNHGHALFVSKWNSSTQTFTVYDPDSHVNSSGDFVRCGNSKPGNFKAQWTKTDVNQWSRGFSTANANQLCVLTAKRSCTPGQTSAAGCASGSEKICQSDFTWGSCGCTPNATRTVDCGVCGHATQTCTSSQTWSTGTCMNGC